MNFNELVKSRRSIRNYLEKDVSDDLILMLLDSARWAPSAGNCQPWHFYVIKDKEVISQVFEKVYHTDWILKAPVLIIVCADISKSEQRYKERGRVLYCIQDTAAAVQNILLCARELGLGACWIGAFDETNCADILSLSDNLRPVAIIPIGYSVDEPLAPKRKPIDEIATFIYPKDNEVKVNIVNTGVRR
ncbi:MAG: nitroreductase family protein [Firmicutes bacterium]|nr:nitroreductase family protein [Bacillota bacterium]